MKLIVLFVTLILENFDSNKLLGNLDIMEKTCKLTLAVWH